MRDNEVTVWLSIEPKPSGGSKKAAVEFALEHNKPWLHLPATRGRGRLDFLETPA